MSTPQNSPWLRNDETARKVGYVLLFFTVVIVGGWTAFAPLDSAALAPGIVQVEGQRKQVQHLEGGRISELLVSNGDKVAAGDPLIRLDATKDKAEKQIITGRLLNAQARVSRLRAERDELEEINFSTELVNSAMGDQRAETAITNEKSLFDVRRSSRNAEEEVIMSRVTGYEAVVESKRIISMSLKQEITDLSELLDDGYVDKQRLRELERVRAGIVGEIADIEVSIEEARLQILQRRKRFKTEVVDELAGVSEQLYDLSQQYSAVNDRVQRATIRSPISGFILNRKPNTIGAVISPGETLMDIVPQVRTLVVAARVSPMDIDRVELGQPAEVRFAVFKDAYTVTGTLTKLSADRLVDEGSDLPYYSAEIKLLETDLSLLSGLSLVPGMPAEVLIKTGERTMLGYLTSPMARLTSRSLIED